MAFILGRQIERKFADQIGISPKQLGEIIRLQAALKTMLEQTRGSLSNIAYTSDYYGQSHFAKDFKEFTGRTPGEFFEDEEMALSSLFYT
jgi:transcriptional regulator GlxA family with amidase domain